MLSAIGFVALIMTCSSEEALSLEQIQNRSETLPQGISVKEANKHLGIGGMLFDIEYFNKRDAQKRVYHFDGFLSSDLVGSEAR